MTAAIAKFAAKKMLSKEMDKYKDKKVESDYVSAIRRAPSEHPSPAAGPLLRDD